MSRPATRGDAATLREFRRSLPMELLKAREAAMSRFRPMLRRHGLTEQQWRVIRALADREPLDAGALAEACCLLAPSLTRILQHLDRKKLVVRSAHESDQRRTMLMLSPAGKRLFAEVAPDSERLYAEIEQQFGAGRLETLYALLSDFYETLAKADGPVAR